MIDVNVCFYGCGKQRTGVDDPLFNGEDDFVCNDCREIERRAKNMDIPFTREEFEQMDKLENEFAEEFIKNHPWIVPDQQ